jgi:hypothetical protein
MNTIPSFQCHVHTYEASRKATSEGRVESRLFFTAPTDHHTHTAHPNTRYLHKCTHSCTSQRLAPFQSLSKPTPATNINEAPDFDAETTFSSKQHTADPLTQPARPHLVLLLSLSCAPLRASRCDRRKYPTFLAPCSHQFFPNAEQFDQK